MSRKRKLSNEKERCRICLVDHGCMTDLLDEGLRPKLDDLVKCTSIDIKNKDGLPNTVCHVCLYKLDLWHEFKEQFILSNKILLEHLDLVGTCDNTNIKCVAACNDLRLSGQDSLSDTVEKKPKTEVPPLIPLDFTNVDCVKEETKIKDIYVSEDDVTSSKDSSQKLNDGSNDDKDKSKEESINKDNDKAKAVSTKAKPVTGKRSKTLEQRKASTKRWVARKRALLAATGESVSDTDSLASEETQLSPVQKARAKTIMDKESEKYKRMSIALKQLETSMSNKYDIGHDINDFICIDSDSDTRKTKSLKDINSDISLTESKPINESAERDTKKHKFPEEDSNDKENSLLLMLESSMTESLTKKSDIEIVEDTFTPCSVKSELEVGDATYIVTSTLMLAEPLSKTSSNSMPKGHKDDGVEHNSQEKNTDIIDAVQLRRINPAPTDSCDKKCIERCLNIEVEGTEIKSLKRVQFEIAGFVEKEMKHRIFGISSNDKENERRNGCKSSCQTLDEQLKNIIEKTIKRNFESSMMRSCGSGLNNNVKSESVSSSTLIKEAANSKKYQPKVVLKRLDVAKENKERNINNIHVIAKRTVKNKLGGPFSMVSHKRQSVLPIRYNDYNTSALDSDSNMSDEVEICEEPKPEAQESVQKSQEIVKRQVPQTDESKTDSNNTAIEPAAKSEIKVGSQNVKVNSPLEEKHTCGVCELSFNTRSEVAAHVRMHKTDVAVRQNKHKMMRCKRCHEIVEARFVKAHVCKSMKQQMHKCYVCNSTFRTEKLLVRHLESHDQSEFNIGNVTKNSKDVGHAKSEKPPSKTENTLAKSENTLAKSENSLEKGSVQSTKESKRDAQEPSKPEKTYTCFLCDKIFTDDEVLKDHLQKHCNDMSEDDQSTGKEPYQCAICGDSLDSEDALEAHVEKHLFDEEDDNPNLINIANETEKTGDDLYRCHQCADSFNSEILLEMHMQAHEEEAAIAEWEKQGVKACEFQCMICDELFETEEELSEHLDIHNGNAYVCQLCEKPFSSLEDLQKHVATH
ncbi:uncharacterized protein LOC143355225 isoform X2 [Halictus rubicundus]|uniref:uncharacterized protein LOC143355225 isoform X2 n=1 Tax=Halictus rubicundus TaxID=77578 RepID=UPI004035EE6B